MLQYCDTIYGSNDNSITLPQWQNPTTSSQHDNTTLTGMKHRYREKYNTTGESSENAYSNSDDKNTHKTITFYLTDIHMHGIGWQPISLRCGYICKPHMHDINLQKTFNCTNSSSYNQYDSQFYASLSVDCATETAILKQVPGISKAFLWSCQIMNN